MQTPIALPQLEVGLVLARRGWPLPPEGVWRGPWRWPTWVVDWRDHPGQRMRVGNGGADDNDHLRPPRSWYFYAPGTVYHEQEQPGADGRTRDQLWFFFTLRRPWGPLAGRPLAVLLDPEERLGVHFDAMAAVQERGEPGHELILHGHALAVLGALLVASQRGGAGTTADPWRLTSGRATGATLLQQVDREALRDPRRPLALAGLAERLGLSTSTLCHRFKAETGGTVMARLRWLRVREAQRLLAQPGATVKEAAWRLGYSSPFHLSQQFHAIVGMTAADFIRRHR